MVTFLYRCDYPDEPPHSGQGEYGQDTKLVKLLYHVDMFYDNKDFSDVKIFCSNKEITAHKVVVCSQSKVLRGICSAGFKESMTNTIDFSTEDQQLIEAMLLFLYRGDYPDIGTESKDDEPQRPKPPGSSPTMVRKLRASPMKIGQMKGHQPYPGSTTAALTQAKFDIPALEDLAKNKHHKVLMPLLIQELLVPFLETVPLIYDTTHENNRGLRDIALVHTKQRKDEIYKNAIVKAKSQEIVADTPQFASDLLLREWSRSRNCCEICDEESEKELEGLVLCPRYALYNGYERRLILFLVVETHTRTRT
ncbi:hypothetical protein OEA41_002675 [Lepraria neglecta]|uniref:BTB domain-containing protein n=1 Tax=Lepraria neglecta TaxID=209136 RepID=A0AAD9Z2W6_9LECA|nr:hypothetical protein OEA41_002675 [Lepraria neglecta]